MSYELTSSFSQSAAPEKPKREPSTRPFSIRLSEGERKSLEAAAGSIPLGTYVRSRLLWTALPRRARHGGVDASLLGKILGLLGRSGLPSGLADLGAAARLGAIELTPDIEAQITSACADIREVRRLLFRSLGLSAEAGR